MYKDVRGCTRMYEDIRRLPKMYKDFLRIYKDIKIFYINLFATKLSEILNCTKIKCK